MADFVGFAVNEARKPVEGGAGRGAQLKAMGELSVGETPTTSMQSEGGGGDGAGDGNRTRVISLED